MICSRVECIPLPIKANDTNRSLQCQIWRFRTASPGIRAARHLGDQGTALDKSGASCYNRHNGQTI
jgi:hypothetical protein